MKKFITLIRRECWEHRTAFFIAPVIVPILLVALALLGDASCVFSEQHTSCDLASSMSGQGVGVVEALSLLEASSGTSARFLEVFLFAISMPVAYIMVLIMLSYLCSCLVDERRDKSILFWNSLPVSQAQIIVSKVVCAVVLIPLVSLVVSMAMQILLMGVMYLRFSGADAALVEAWHDISLMSTLAAQVVNYGVFMLASLALVGYIMLLSAYFNRPFIMGLIILVGLLIVEVIVLGSHTFRSVLLDTPFLSSSLFGYGLPENAMDFAANKPFGLLSDHSVRRIASPAVWIGVAIGGSFIAAAAAVRKHRSQA